MKVEELRIGNSCLVKGNYENSGDYRISYITANHIKEIELNELLCEPIPLTEEILLKCGFKKLGETIFFIDLECGSIYYNDELEKGISISIGEYCSRGICFENIKYLHQLQNLYFALTNQELNIEL